MDLTEVERQWLRENLRKVPFLDALGDQDVEILIRHLGGLTLPGNKTLLLQGQEGTQLYLIYNGRVSVWVRREGKRTKLASLKRGNAFGEISVLTGRPTNAEVVTAAPSKFFVLPPKPLREIAQRNPGFVEKALAFIRDRVEKRDRAWEELGYRDFEELNDALRDFLKPSA